MDIFLPPLSLYPPERGSTHVRIYATRKLLPNWLDLGGDFIGSSWNPLEERTSSF